MNEPMKILIAYDGSDCAKAMIYGLHRAGLPQSARVIVVSVAETWIPVPQNIGGVDTGFTEWLTHPLGEAGSLAQQAGEHIRTRFPGWEVSIKALSGSPARAVIEKADEWKPDLIVVGSHGRSALGQLLLGSVSQKVATEAHCSVHISRPSLRSKTLPVRIILGFDGSLDAEEAAHQIAERHGRDKTEIRLIAVLPPKLSTTPLLPWTPEQVEAREADARRWMEQHVAVAVSRLQTSGHTVSATITEGIPVRILLDEASGWDADLIFLGARGHHRLERFLLGSVSTAVISRASCSVEIVRTC
jgi:nucleotide-binding universal stress UspA family protein